MSRIVRRVVVPKRIAKKSKSPIENKHFKVTKPEEKKVISPALRSRQVISRTRNNNIYQTQE